MLVVPHISQLLKHFSFVFLPAAKSKMSCWSFLFSLVKLHGQWRRKICFSLDLVIIGDGILLLKEFTSPRFGVPLSLPFLYGSVVLTINSVF